MPFVLFRNWKKRLLSYVPSPTIRSEWPRMPRTMLVKRELEERSCVSVLSTLDTRGEDTASCCCVDGCRRRRIHETVRPSGGGSRTAFFSLTNTSAIVNDEIITKVIVPKNSADVRKKWNHFGQTLHYNMKLMTAEDLGLPQSFTLRYERKLG